MLREQKNDFVSRMRTDLDRAAGVLFLDYTGLTVEEANTLRRKLGNENVAYTVVKNTLMTRALAETAYADAAACLKGTPTGVVVGYEDPVAAAKLTYEMLNQTQHLKVKGGIVENKAIGPAEAEALSKMPSRGEMQAMIVVQALSPGRTIAGQLKNPAGRIVGAIDALVDKLGGETSDVAENA